MDVHQSLANETAGPSLSSSQVNKDARTTATAPGPRSETEDCNISKQPSFDAPHVPPLSPKLSNHSVRYGVVQKVQALTLLSEGFPVGYITQRTGIPSRSLNRIRKVAAERGYRPAEDARILEAYVIDGKRPGRPKKTATEINLNEETESVTLGDDQRGSEPSPPDPPEEPA